MKDTLSKRETEDKLEPEGVISESEESETVLLEESLYTTTFMEEEPERPSAIVLFIFW